jgi:hypothetical protein
VENVDTRIRTGGELPTRTTPAAKEFESELREALTAEFDGEETSTEEVDG